MNCFHSNSHGWVAGAEAGAEGGVTASFEQPPLPDSILPTACP